jgi:hypothetical protein
MTSGYGQETIAAIFLCVWFLFSNFVLMQVRGMLKSGILHCVTDAVATIQMFIAVLNVSRAILPTLCSESDCLPAITFSRKISIYRKRTKGASSSRLINAEWHLLS